MVTSPEKIDGLAAGRITLTTFSIPDNSNVLARSRYLLSIVWIPVIVANTVGNIQPYTIKNKDAILKFDASINANGDNKIAGTTLTI